MVFKLLYSLIKKISLKQTRLFVNTSAMITDKKKIYNNVVPKKNTHICRYWKKNKNQLPLFKEK